MRWVIFRQVALDRFATQPEIPGAIFRPRFHVKGMTPQQNIRFSLIPIPFFIGMPGFRSKIWLLNETSGDFQGYYEWDTVEAALNYAHSFAMRFMTKRAIPGSVSWRLLDRSSGEIITS